MKRKIFARTVTTDSTLSRKASDLSGRLEDFLMTDLHDIENLDDFISEDEFNTLSEALDILMWFAQMMAPKPER